MKLRLASVVAILISQSFPVAALTVAPGEVIRGAYTFPTFGSAALVPTSFLLRLSSLDLFGDGDSVGIRYLDTTLAPLSFTRFDSVGSGLDPSVGIVFGAGDMLPPATTPSVPSSGFVEIVGLAGSFDVLSLDLSATEAVSVSGFLRRTNVSDFERVARPVAPVPVPPAGALLLISLGGGLGLRRLVQKRVA